MRNDFKIKHLYIIPMLFALWIMGCDKIDDPYTTGQFEPNIPLSADTVKKVLLEDFTGMRCHNCPEAARLAHEIALTKRNRLIIMSVHAGGLAIPALPAKMDLRCQEGLKYFSDFGFSGTPNGLINRRLRSQGDYHYASSEWNDAINLELKEEMTFKLKGEGSLSNNGKTINAKITYTALKPSEKSYNLLIFLVEDGIIGMQLDGSVWDSVYVFHNVLRETIQPDPYGEPIEVPTIGVNYTKEINYEIRSLAKKFNGYSYYDNEGTLIVRPPSKYKLIVAITNRNSRYIEQVEEISLENL